jgi:hypothetical protein
LEEDVEVALARVDFVLRNLSDGRPVYLAFCFKDWNAHPEFYQNWIEHVSRHLCPGHPMMKKAMHSAAKPRYNMNTNHTDLVLLNVCVKALRARLAAEREAQLAIERAAQERKQKEEEEEKKREAATMQKHLDFVSGVCACVFDNPMYSDSCISAWFVLGLLPASSSVQFNC